jgi:HD-GYP domain-containing protein (c-di-GMP phosphodiesterase class II)
VPPLEATPCGSNVSIPAVDANDPLLVIRLATKTPSVAVSLPAAVPSLEPPDVVAQSMLAALRVRDHDTCEHVQRVADLGLELAAVVAPELASTRCLWHAFVLHDVGKIGMPDFAFDKPGPLEDWERAILETHPLLGGRMLDELSFLPPIIHDVVTCHHERWDGTGYPLGLEGCQIPLAARIFSAVDAFDAMTNDRVYQQAVPISDALTEIEHCAGTQFDPRIARAFGDLISDRTAKARTRREVLPTAKRSGRRPDIQRCPVAGTTL